jgi:hypothetical protein
MNTICLMALAVGMSTACLAAADATSAMPAKPAQTDLVFREPFTLKLRVDKDHFYEEHYDRRIPYVAANDVYLFCGESFGLKLGITNGEVATVTYQKEKTGADVEVELKQEDGKDGEPMTMLLLKSNVEKTLFIDALMTVPERKGIYKTSILPLQAGLMGFESWPHPIVQLVLRNLRFKQTTPNQSPEVIRPKTGENPQR